MEVAGRKVREAPATFSDHFSQPRLFWLSLSPVEREHVIAACTFELGECHEQAIRERRLKVRLVGDQPLRGGFFVHAIVLRAHGERKV
ncbi:catalase-related domain-containing protein [Nonomuraea spiralis]|uniref:catalase n=1 Tax=Nonomuraea spiralis TaxID=46182 RepID=A0ABV5IR75_9ACTN|nr:catalase-related domain-containing protein [Nonomuraea spiralis]GGT08936.1 hypothetical protein GCM10010176_061860 [Nonomuraea spiralis]